MSHIVATRAEALIDALEAIRGDRRLCLEECPQSAWLAEVLSPHVVELVVIGLGDLRSRGPKSDARDAFGLANKLRLRDYGTPVFKPVGVYAKLRQLSNVHRQVVRDVTRVKSRIKACLRARGVPASGRAPYSKAGRPHFIAALRASASTRRR